MRSFEFAIVLAVIASAGVASANPIVYADWSLGAGSYTGGNTGMPADSVGGHNFNNPYGSGGGPTGPAIGGPSSSSSAFTGTGGFYGIAAGSNTLPTDNFTVSIYAQPSSTTAGYLLSTNGGNADQIQIGLSSGVWNAYFTNSGSNGSGTVIGSAPATALTDYLLQVTDSNNTMTFAVNGIAVGSLAATTFGGFGAIHLAVSPGANPTPFYAGNASDLTITSVVPEPASATLLGLGGLGATLALLTARKRARCAR